MARNYFKDEEDEKNKRQYKKIDVNPSVIPFKPFTMSPKVQKTPIVREEQIVVNNTLKKSPKKEFVFAQRHDNVKKDALWKPLLRRFRRFVKRMSQNNMLISQKKTHKSQRYEDDSILIQNSKTAKTQSNAVNNFAFDIYDSLELP